jgi:hypothetical protein
MSPFIQLAGDRMFESMAENTKLNFSRTDFLQVILPYLSAQYNTSNDLTPDLLWKAKIYISENLLNGENIMSMLVVKVVTLSSANLHQTLYIYTVFNVLICFSM